MSWLEVIIIQKLLIDKFTLPENSTFPDGVTEQLFAPLLEALMVMTSEFSKNALIVNIPNNLAP